MPAKTICFNKNYNLVITLPRTAQDAFLSSNKKLEVLKNTLRSTRCDTTSKQSNAQAGDNTNGANVLTRDRSATSASQKSGDNPANSDNNYDSQSSRSCLIPSRRCFDQNLRFFWKKSKTKSEIKGKFNVNCL